MIGARDLLKKLRGLLFCGGLEKSVYEKYEAYILLQDMKNLRAYLLVTGAGFLALGIASLFTHKISDVNTMMYLITAGAMAVMLIAQPFLMRLKGDTAAL